ncbi:hypothetical protein ACO22_06698 [Paracoccidioides brasiliensis]|uniref:Uncharacterized protein n=1 Tax=Paracoccidioides brasiliensis TaxID=121759 RepID=A0A1D2J6Q5_PARBR|nr:hypothetical protein ACO22_06698 [Paracoccidioides brasiliensis]
MAMAMIAVTAMAARAEGEGGEAEAEALTEDDSVELKVLVHRGENEQNEQGSEGRNTRIPEKMADKRRSEIICPGEPIKGT